MSKNTTGYTFDYERRTIILSTAFNRKARNPQNSEYSEILQLRESFPDFKFRVRKINHKPNKITFAHLTYENMAVYISAKEGKHSENLKVLDRIKVAAKAQSAPYLFVKDWFLSQYPDYSDFRALIDKQQTANKEESTESGGDIIDTVSEPVDEITTPETTDTEQEVA